MPENNTFETSDFTDPCFCFSNREGAPLSPTFFLWKKLLQSMKQMILCSSKKFTFSRLLRSSHWTCSYKKVFLGILQNLQENTSPRVSFFNRESLFRLRAATLLSFIKKRLWHRCFPKNSGKFLSKPFLQNTSELLILSLNWRMIKEQIAERRNFLDIL